RASEPPEFSYTWGLLASKTTESPGPRSSLWSPTVIRIAPLRTTTISRDPGGGHEGPALEFSVHRAQGLGFSPSQHRELGPGLADQIGERDSQPRGDLPQDADRRIGLARFDLRKRRSAHPGELGQLVERHRAPFA